MREKTAGNEIREPNYLLKAIPQAQLAGCRGRGMREKRERLWTKQFWMLLVITLLSGGAGQMTVPLVAKYALDLGADLTLASTAAGLMSMVSLFVCPFAGSIADRVSRKWILIFANLGYAICLFGHAFCASVTALIVMRLLTGVFFSVISVTNVAFSSNFIRKERMGEGLGYVALASIVAQAYGPMAGLGLLDAGGFGASFVGAGLACIVCVFVIFLMPSQEEPKIRKERKKVSVKDLYAVEFTAFMLMAMLFSSGNGLVSTYLKLIAEERAIANISLFFTVYSLFMIFLRPFTGKIVDQRGVFVILIPSFLFAAAGMIFVGLGTSLGMMLAAGAFKALGQGSGTPSLQAHCVKTFDKERAGVATSTIMIGQNVGNALAPIIGSFFVGSVGYRGMFCGAGAIILLLGFVLVLLQYRTEKRKLR